MASPWVKESARHRFVLWKTPKIIYCAHHDWPRILLLLFLTRCLEWCIQVVVVLEVVTQP
ncbi:hypothetical protein IscW_ISCW013274 [Ixodes scapularis]|uniref:Uncharacterized protein n=1 Tax=Ixodes scapularis TaxID=6945 RepID=B7QA45_IXOSC|nr:hypothetical protein IscW_ISCW013274 [Ixodes scapularis]|eukprot:XP_002399985.1 hypothetical protein IscW_ISCW013274 [Ixodes scapularis]